MSYAFSTVVRQDEAVDELWAPKILDAEGRVAFDDADAEVRGFRADGMSVYRGGVDKRHRLLQIEGSPIAVHVTRSRLVAVCPAHRDRRSAGAASFRVGQLRWPWLGDVGYTAREGRLSANQVRLTALDGETREWVYVDFQLPASEDPRAAAQSILDAAVSARASVPDLPDGQRQELESLVLTPHDPKSRSFSMVKLPGTRRAAPETAGVPSMVNGHAHATAQPAAEPETERLAPAAGDGAAAPDARCSDCGHPAPAGARFCRLCGAPVEVAAAAPGPVAEPAPPVPEPAHRCTRCAQVAPAGARFCRACGGPVVAIAAPDPVPDEPRCPECAEPVREGQRFCRRCGHDIDAGEQPTRVLASPASAPAVPPAAAPAQSPAPRPAAPPGRPRRRRLAAAIGLAVVLIAAAGAGAFLLLREDSPGKRPERATKAGSAAARARDLPEVDTTPTATPAAVDDEAAAVPAATPAPADLAGMPAGRYVRLGSFRTQTRAQSEADRLQAAGIDAQVISSDEAEDMVPAFWVAVVGPFDTAREERRAIRAAKRAGVPDAFAGDLAGGPGTVEPEDLVGVFEGDLTQTHPKDSRQNKTFPATISFEGDGRGGTIVYDDIDCEGTLSLIGGPGPVLRYRESITTGRCTDGGTWHVKREGDELLATWWKSGDLGFVLGRLEG